MTSLLRGMSLSISFEHVHLDSKITRYLDVHVMDGYKFLMQNYRAGDKICIFGKCDFNSLLNVLMSPPQGSLGAPTLQGL